MGFSKFLFLIFFTLNISIKYTFLNNKNQLFFIPSFFEKANAENFDSHLNSRNNNNLTNECIHFFMNSSSTELNFSSGDSSEPPSPLSPYIENGKNKPLVKMMIHLNEDMGALMSFASQSRQRSPQRNEIQNIKEHMDRFVRIAKNMDLHGESSLMPGRTAQIEVQRRADYLKMYKVWTRDFYRLAIETQSAFESENWELLNQKLSEILSFTALAHRAVDSNKF